MFKLIIQHTTSELQSLESAIKDIVSCNFKITQCDSALFVYFENAHESQIKLYASLLKEKGWVVEEDELGLLICSQRVQTIIELSESPILYVDCQEELDKLKDLFATKSFLKLTHNWHQLTGGEIIDRREDSEYTNCNAQRDPDFWEEESITK